MSRSRRWCATAVAALLGVGFFLWVWLEPGGPRLAMAFSDLATVGVCLLAAGTCLQAAAHSADRTRLGWSLLGAGILARAAGGAHPCGRSWTV